MKIPFKTTLLIPLLSVVLAEEDKDTSKVDDWRETQIRELVRECAKLVGEAEVLPPNEAIPKYGYVLTRLGGWNRPDSVPIYKSAQAKLLSIPGHARYFRDQIEDAKRRVREGEMRLFDWGSEMPLVLETLGHMPSEETVEVLAGYLEDRFADPTSGNPEDRNIPDLPPWTVLGPHFDFLGRGAVTGLERLGIEDAPPRPTVKGPPSPWIAWWKEVSSGKRKYRFKGSDVWHPVATASNPSGGTPRAGPGPSTDPARAHSGDRDPSPRDGPSVEAPASGKSGNPLLWPTLAAIAAVLGALGYLLFRKSAA